MSVRPAAYARLNPASPYRVAFDIGTLILVIGLVVQWLQYRATSAATHALQL